MLSQKYRIYRPCILLSSQATCHLRMSQRSHVFPCDTRHVAVRSLTGTLPFRRFLAAPRWSPSLGAILALLIRLHVKGAFSAESETQALTPARPMYSSTSIQMQRRKESPYREYPAVCDQGSIRGWHFFSNGLKRPVISTFRGYVRFDTAAFALLCQHSTISEGQFQRSRQR